MMKNRSLEELINFIQENIKIGTYIPLNKIESKIIRNYYLEELNFELKKDVEIFDLITGIKIASGYERIVVGDYGPYLEINSNQIEFDNLYIKQNQSWRLNSEKFKNVKYYWYEIAENSAKIYYQISTVKYADYKVGYYYVSPYEIKLGE